MNKGDRIGILNNSIFKAMGYDKVTGTVILASDHSIAIQCDQTRCIETADVGDGTIEQLSTPATQEKNTHE